MADWNEPDNDSIKEDVLPDLNAKILSVAKMNFSSDSNVPTGAVRFNTTTKTFQTWSGSAWGDLQVCFLTDVGVDTSSPGADLDVGPGTGAAAPQVRLNGGSGSGSGGFVSFANGGTANSAVGAYSGIVGGAQNNSLTLYAGTGTEVRMLTNGVNERYRCDSSGNHAFPSASTTASAANAYLDSGSSPANRLLRSTSSGRYKRDVEDLDPAAADRLLALRPVWYRSKAEADRPDWSWYGLIAEEVAAVDPRLVHWGYADDAFEEVEVGPLLGEPQPLRDETGELVRDERGRPVKVRAPLLGADGRPVVATERWLKADAAKVPDGVQYERLSVLLLDVVRRQRDQLDALAGRVAALEAKLAP